MDDFNSMLVLVSYLFLLVTYYKINNLTFLDKCPRSVLNRLEPVVLRGIERLIKAFVALTLSTGLYMTGLYFSGLILALTMLLVWYQCYDIFKGILSVEFSTTKDWVDNRGNMENRIKMHLKTTRGEYNER